MQQSTRAAARPRSPVLAEPAEVVVDKLLANPEQWYRIAGTDYCKAPEDHRVGCQCSVRTLTQTAHRIRTGVLGAFARIKDGCFQVVATSAASRPDRKYDVEIKARWRRCDC